MSYSIKQIIVIRKDLQMRKGKMCAQASHASMMRSSNAMRSLFNFNPIPLIKMLMDKEYRLWTQSSFTKVCVYVNSQEELERVKHRAEDFGLSVSTVVDSGKTEFNGESTVTCIAIGPHYAEKFNNVTEHLKLL